MLIIAVIALAVVLFVGLAVRHEERPHLALVLVLVLQWCLVWLPILQTELTAKRGRGTYGTDADYYFECMVRACQSSTPVHTALAGTSGGYVLFGALAMLTSPSHSVVWVKLANVSLLILLLSLLYWLMRQRGIAPGTSLFVVFLMGFNGIVTWMAIRNLKDTLFITVCFLEMAVVYQLIYKCKSAKHVVPLLVVGLTVLFGHLISALRPWGMFFSVTIVLSITLGASFEGRLRRVDCAVIGVVAVVACIVSHAWFAGQIEIYRIFREHNQEVSHLTVGTSSGVQMLLAPARFLLGPGIVRALYPDQAFRVTAITGNVLIFLGSLVWWALLPVLVLIARHPASQIVKNMTVWGPALCFLGVYSFAYGGTADTRTRAVFYLLAAPGIGFYMAGGSHCSIRRRQARIVAYCTWLVVVVFTGIVLSYMTLK